MLPSRMLQNNAAVDDPDGFGVEMINGFAHLKTPIIVDETLMLYLPIIVEDLFRRGLRTEILKNTLNARIRNS
jgi:hypothetical protein